MLLSGVKILNVTGMKVWHYQLCATLNFMQLTPDPFDCMFSTLASKSCGFLLISTF